MSYVSLRADAERMYVSPWHLPHARRFRKTAAELRTAIIARVLGPNHPGFKGKPADIDAHLTVLVDCSLGRHGRALQIAITAYGNAQLAAETLARLTAKKRGRDRAVEAEAAADARQWLAISRSARQVYLAARAVRGECAIDVLPEGCEAPDYMLWKPPMGTFGAPVKQPWPVPQPAPVTVPAAALVAHSANAVAVARTAADAANVLRLARVDAIPAIRLPDACGIEDTPEPRDSVQQRLVAELGQFIMRLENQTREAA